MRVAIDRAKWINGRNGGAKKLLESDTGMRCCLGFLGQECGLPDAEAAEGFRTVLGVEVEFVGEYPEELHQ